MPIGGLSSDPSLTYHGALQILGRYDHPRVERIDKILGGIILGAGAAAGISALLSSPLGAALGLGLIWTWVEQKNEAVGLLRSTLDSVLGKISKIAGYERYQLVPASHTILVVASFFEALQQYLGRTRYARLEITDEERAHLAFGPASHGGRLLQAIYQSTVPAPSPTQGFEESVPLIAEWISGTANHTERFLEGLHAWPDIKRSLAHDDEKVLTDQFVAAAVARYRSNYLSIATKVPEFAIWMALGEHSATRYQLSALSDELRSALQEQTVALSRLESLLNLSAGPTNLQRRADLRIVLERANRGVLKDSILPDAVMPGSDTLVNFPTVERIYLSPRYRIATMGVSARPADESWWNVRPIRSDLDLMLAGQLTAPEAAYMPLLFLGHPGAGKSLLTQVITARLPSSSFTALRVQLRRVKAGAPLLKQIQAGLDAATNGRVTWSDLAEQSSTTVRLVLLDGLDELLQAASDRGAYLQELIDFQRREADQERPVLFIVTCRTVVADRIAIPPGTTLIKLEGFDDNQVATWLDTWNEINRSLDSSRTRTHLTANAALRHRDLATQPLLLLMLALYSAEPTSPPIENSLSSADLYRRIIDLFIAREISKDKGTHHDVAPSHDPQKDLWRLAVAAFAMFNRGRHDVTDAELRADLDGLRDGADDDSALTDIGGQLIGRFFFVHVSEGQNSKRLQFAKAYEFLHSTFSEYLMASRIVAILLRTRSGVSSNVGPDTYGLLYALLSHQPLAATKSALKFASELFSEVAAHEQAEVLASIDEFILRLRFSGGSEEYGFYRPSELGYVSRLSTFSANLVLLRVMLEVCDSGFELRHLARSDEDSLAIWRSMVLLWRAGLEPDGFQAMLSAIARDGGRVRRRGPDEELPTEWTDILSSRLIGDKNAESLLRLGTALREGFVYFYGDDDPKDVAVSAAVPLIMAPGSIMASGALFDNEDFRPKAVQFADAKSGLGYSLDVEEILMRFLVLRSRDLPLDTARAGIRWLLKLGASGRRSAAIAAVVASQPDLLDDAADLWNPAIYDRASSLVIMLSPRRLDARLRKLAQVIEQRFNNAGPTSYNVSGFSSTQLDVIEVMLDGYRVVAGGPGGEGQIPTRTWPDEKA